MRQILYFIIGILISFIIIHSSYSDGCDVDFDNDHEFLMDWVSCVSESYGGYDIHVISVGTFTGYLDGLWASDRVEDAVWAAYDNYPGSLYSYVPDCGANNYYDGDGNLWVRFLKARKDGGDIYFIYGFRCNEVTTCPLPPDSDNDGIPDDFEIDPSRDYTGAITAVVYDSTTKQIVAGEILLDNGDIYSFGEVPADLDGYTLETLDSGIVLKSGLDLYDDLQKLNCDMNFQLISSGNYAPEADGTFDNTGPSSLPTVRDYIDILPLPEVGTYQAPDSGISTGNTASESRTGSETDSEAFGKTITNTAATASNVARSNDYLKVNNDLLAEIIKKIGTMSSGTVVVSSDSESGLTADEIGQSVRDNLIDPSQTYDSSGTENISHISVDETQLEDVKTKYSDRFDLFLNNIKGTDLFGQTLGIFENIPGSSVSAKTVNIGFWGGSTQNTVSIDMSDYDNIWNVLGSIILIMASYAAFKIVVTKRA